MKIFEKLTKNILKCNNQGYALYYYNNGETLELVNGKVRDQFSEDITFNTNFRLASVSKQFIAFSIVNLIQEEKISYETNILTIFNDLPDYFKNITIKNLLNHTSGIYDYEDMEHKEDDPQVKDKDILDFLKKTNDTYFKVGTKYKYSNTAYILLGLIVEKVSKMSISEYIENNVFKKAGMLKSKVNIQGVTEIENRAYGHLLDNENNLYVKDQYWCSATIGDGGLYSSINDLKKWCKYLVSTSNFSVMKVPNYVGNDEYNFYGLGIRTIEVDGNLIHYHCGDTIGTNTLLLFSIDLNLCLIFLTNLGGIDTEIMKNNLIELIKGKI